MEIPAQPSPVPAPAEPPIPERTIFVHLITDDLNATLSRFKGVENRRSWGRRGSYLRRVEIWGRICRAPCDLAVDSDDYFEVDGLGIRDSKTFQLPTSGAVTLNVKTGHPGTLTGGVLLTSLGSLPLIVGLVFTSLGAALYQRPEGPGFLITGGITLGVGVPLVAGGIYMLVNSKTRVWTSDGYRLAARRWPRLALSTAGLHF